MPGTAGFPDTRVQQAQVVVDFSDRAHGRAGVVGGRFLLDGDSGRQALDMVHIRFFHQGQELSGIGREGFYIAALAFGIECVERQ